MTRQYVPWRALLTLAGPVAAQNMVPGEPYATDPVGIVADPCPSHSPPAGGDGGW
ncbi:hypothetical protein FHT02_003808 [Sphingomonas xinjiangensis]|uniref:Uncharacterized protein n=1 Tax=Sphingomonas xinjiangensis TaxID=643568 RepID=A0A840YS92_9SPHN|nr:hypothetical protein [Sphingomonas xinjiangensis]